MIPVQFDSRAPNLWGAAIFTAREYLDARATMGDCETVRKMFTTMDEATTLIVRLGALMGGAVRLVEIEGRAEERLAPEPASREHPEMVIIVQNRNGHLFECGRIELGSDRVAFWSWTRRPIATAKLLLQRALSALAPPGG